MQQDETGSTYNHTSVIKDLKLGCTNDETNNTFSVDYKYILFALIIPNVPP